MDTITNLNSLISRTLAEVDHDLRRLPSTSGGERTERVYNIAMAIESLANAQMTVNELEIMGR